MSHVFIAAAAAPAVVVVRCRYSSSTRHCITSSRCRCPCYRCTTKHAQRITGIIRRAISIIAAEDCFARKYNYTLFSLSLSLSLGMICSREIERRGERRGERIEQKDRLVDGQGLADRNYSSFRLYSLSPSLPNSYTHRQSGRQTDTCTQFLCCSVCHRFLLLFHSLSLTLMSARLQQQEQRQQRALTVAAALLQP